MENNSTELFDQKFLERLRALFLKLRKRGKLKKKGIQPTVSAGFSREFKDRRQYASGDDIRAVDWKVYARLENMFIKVFEEIQEFHIHIVIDNSASMAKPYSSKRIGALHLVAALSYLGLVNGHRISLHSMSDDITRITPPMKGQGHIHRIIKMLEKLKFDGVTNLQHCLQTFRPSRDRRGMVFLISDFFGRDPSTSIDALRSVVKYPSESHVIQIVDPAETIITVDGELTLIDIETNEQRRMWISRNDIAMYENTFKRFTDDIHQTCMRYQIDSILWNLNTPFEDFFLDLLARNNLLTQT